MGLVAATPSGAAGGKWVILNSWCNIVWKFENIPSFSLLSPETFHVQCFCWFVPNYSSLFWCVRLMFLPFQERWTRGDGFIEEDRPGTGSEEDQGHPPPDWRPRGGRGASPQTHLHHPVWYPHNPEQSPSPPPTASKTIVVMQFSFFPSNPLLSKH